MVVIGQLLTACRVYLPPKMGFGSLGIYCLLKRKYIIDLQVRTYTAFFEALLHTGSGRDSGEKAVNA